MRKLCLTALVSATLLYASIAFPADYTIIQLTDNDYNDYAPQISDSGYVVWVGGDDDDSEIFLYDGSGIIQLTDNDGYDTWPQINAGGQVVWEGWDGTDLDYEIFLYDGSAVTQITDNETDDHAPRINSAGIIVWYGSTSAEGASTWEIFRYDGSGIEMVSGGAYGKKYPLINDNDMIVWLNSYEEEIYARDGAVTWQVSQGTGAYLTYFELNDGNQVVWTGFDDTTYAAHIYLNDGPATSVLSGGHDINYDPRINNNGAVTWTGYTDDYQSDIYVYDGSGVTRLTEADNEYLHCCARINDAGWVIWTGEDEAVTNEDAYIGDGYEVFVYDGDTVTQLTNTDWHSGIDPGTFYYVGSPGINSSGYLVWYGWDGDDTEIFLAVPDQPAVSEDTLDVPFFSQNDNEWAGDQLGDCPGLYMGWIEDQSDYQAVRARGSATACRAMVFNYIEPGFTDPGSLNACFTSDCGYVNACLMPLDGNGCCAPEGVRFKAYQGSPALFEDAIDASLSNGRPVIARVSTDQTFSHFVVITGREGDTWKIKDPWDQEETERTMESGALGSYEITGLWLYL